MGSISRATTALASARPECECIDIRAELSYWRLHLGSEGRQDSAVNFDDYRATIKFAYDAYLKWHREPLHLLGPTLRQTYEQQVSYRDRLDWFTAEQIIHDVWDRIQTAGACCDGEARTGEPIRPAPALAATVN
ncbi:hypothetical protein [Pseudoxanthomonas wuyuanensis]